MAKRSSVAPVENDDGDGVVSVGCDEEFSANIELPRTFMHNLRLLACFFGPVLMMISLSTFKGNIRMANKLGLQRMRTQRSIKRAQIRQTNCTLDRYLLDPVRSIDVIRAKHKNLKQASRSEELKVLLGNLGDEIDTFEDDLNAFDLYQQGASFPCEEWSRLNDQASIIVAKYTKAIETFDLEQSLLYWFVVFFNTTCWFMLAYLMQKHKKTAVQIAHTRAHEEKAAADRLRIDMQSRRFLHEIMNHRFGNRIRQARLLFDQKQYDDLEVILRTWEYETDIRMGMLSNLPTCAISAKDLFAQVFTFHHTISCFCDTSLPLFFYDAAHTQISYPILQVAFLQDVASNILKHGGAYARIEIDQTQIIISNNIVNSDNKRASHKIGLNALMEQSKYFNITFRSQQDSIEFKSIFTLRTEPEEKKQQEPKEKKIANTLTPDYNDLTKKYTWLLVEDSNTIAELTAKQYKKFGVDLHPLSAASDVFALEAIIVESSRKTGKPLVVIFDENIFSLNTKLDIVPETGTQLRARILQNAVCADLYTKKKLLFVSCSASEVEDDKTLICKLGKSTPPRRQIARLCETLAQINKTRKMSSKPSRFNLSFRL